LQVATSPCCQRDFPDVMLRIFPEMLEPIPRRSAECVCLVLPQPSSAFPIIRLGRLSRFLPRTRLFTGRLSRLQLFRYVQASQFARLPDRSYRCKFPCRAAEASTSEQNVRRCLRTHRTYYPPDYRQLAERGLSPRKTRSLVGCSRMMPTFPSPPLKYRTAGFPQYGFKAGLSEGAFPARRPIVAPNWFASLFRAPRFQTCLPPLGVGAVVRLSTAIRATMVALPQGSSLRSGLFCPGPSTLN
jgi:hypothetical protein